MKYSEAKQGRTFILRLEDGEVIHEVIERFAVEQSITSAYLIALGGIDKYSKLVTGPENGRTKIIKPNLTEILNVHEVSGTGTIFHDKNGKPSLHMHLSCGRENSSVTGCIRSGVVVWHVLEIIIIELLNSTARRLHDKVIGFELLEP